MNSRLISKELEPILRKVENGLRISGEEAIALYESVDLNGIGGIANIVRERKNGNVATYIHNRYINYSNVCLLSCQFCAFGAKKREAHAFEFTIPQIVETVRSALQHGITEIHMVGGLHPTLKGEWYLELLRSLRVLDEKLIIKAFTAIEIRHLSERAFRKSVRETLELLGERLGAITEAEPKSLILRFVTRFAAAKRAPSGPRCTAPGTRWADTAPARCCMAISSAPIIALTTCVVCENCRMRPAASRDSFLLLSSPMELAPFSMEFPMRPLSRSFEIWR
jgi:aminodeoxyfutalosine synthase